MYDASIRIVSAHALVAHDVRHSHQVSTMKHWDGQTASSKLLPSRPSICFKSFMQCCSIRYGHHDQLSQVETDLIFWLLVMSEFAD